MPENYILLERTELNASAASVTFSNIPQTGYTDLKIVYSARSNSTSGYAETVNMKFNNSSTSDYTWRGLYSVTATPGSNNSGGSVAQIRAGNVPSANLTASTFSNNEIYIPNYTSANFKSVSIDAVSEVNGSTDFTYTLMLQAGLRSNTAAITDITLSLDAAGTSFVAGSTFSLYGIAAVGTTPVIAPKASGGNIIDYDGTYWIHTFLTSGTFTPQVGLTCDYLVVAGGGGGGGQIGGGGGAGGFRTATAQALTTTGYTVTVGGGGSAGTGSSTNGTNGIDSSFNSLVASGGGRGGAIGSPRNGATGGSGGGSGNTGSGAAGNSGSYSPVEGFAGGTGGISGNKYYGGGGGGASAVGASGTTGNGNNGGAGTASSISGSSVTYAGGGGAGYGSDGSNVQTGGTGGAGGGGNGGKGDGSDSFVSASDGTAGTANRGGGGGGGGYNGSTGKNGGAGGSGIVIIRYPAT